MKAYNKVVSIGSVVTHGSSRPMRRNIDKMKSVLERQGQIEPLQVKPHGVNYKTYEQDAWGDDIVWAAQELGWPTLLVCVTERYIQ